MTTERERDALKVLVNEVAWSIDYHQSDDVSYPGYINIEWDDLVKFAATFPDLIQDEYQRESVLSEYHSITP